MNRIWIGPITIVVVSIVLAFLIAPKASGEKNVLRYRAFVPIVGVFVLAAGFALAVLFVLQNGNAPTMEVIIPVGGAILVPGGIGLQLILCRNFQIVFEKESWHHTNLFGKKKTYLYTNITKVVVKEGQWYHIYVGSQKIKIDYLFVNFDSVMYLLRKGKVHKTASIYQLKNSTHKE